MPELDLTKNVDMENASKFVAQWSKETLEYWLALAEVYDSYGLPIDLIFIKCREENTLPILFQKATENDGKEVMFPRFVNSEEFEDGIKFFVRVRQVGGLDVVIEHLSKTDSDKPSLNEF